ncbi:WAS/WASL-interacting protein family member 1-like, partial [Nilaparvata lugens]|uniref:WAS/WASL-interacting protein family member 1-like n=1 Tax=Nilaparvata lugens TaxID=108931 RepID=UPI00193EAE6D
MEVQEVPTEDEDTLLEGGGGGFSISPAYGTSEEAVRPATPPSAVTKLRPRLPLPPFGYEKEDSLRLGEQPPPNPANFQGVPAVSRLPAASHRHLPVPPLPSTQPNRGLRTLLGGRRGRLIIAAGSSPVYHRLRTRPRPNHHWGSAYGEEGPHHPSAPEGAPRRPSEDPSAPPGRSTGLGQAV